MDIAALGSSSNTGVTNDVGDNIMGKDAFLNLLLKQLSYQDPLNPMDSTQFTTQLSQFSSLEELTNINSTLGDVLAYQQSMQNASVTSMIGKTVMASGNTTYLNNTADIGYDLSADASAVNISVMDSTGKIVSSIKLSQQGAGSQSHVWDGKDNQGNQLPDGIYTFDVQAQDISGNPITASTSTTGIVSSISFKDNATYLILEGGRNVHLSEIKSIG